MAELADSPPTGRILVVDDTEYNRDLLERRLSRRGFNVDAVEDGRAALDAIAATDYAIVLLDIMMPGIDGYEVLERLRETRSATELPIIMVTAKDESADIVRALKLGANDYITKPIDFAVALARINTHLLVSSSQAELRIAHTRMKRDLDAAAITQRRLLPGGQLDDERIAFGWEYRPCDELGGDMVNFFRIDDDRIGLYVIDVSGHGVQSALLSFALSQNLSPGGAPGAMVLEGQLDAQRPASPDTVIERLNAKHSMDANGGLIATMQYGVIDLAVGTFTFVSAGHPDPVLIRDGETSIVTNVGGPPIGVLEDVKYELRKIELAPGDRIVMISDGVYEQYNSDGIPFGLDRYESELAGSIAIPVTDALSGLVRSVENWAGDREISDDISILGFDIRSLA